jgi:threonylcarbamoyladenosine tRNA methylthiotransferase MtaB
MQRRYNRELYTARIAAIRRVMPHACIGVDVIVGFPGETEGDFADTIHYLSDLEISYLHVFTYSERPGTKAVEMPRGVPVHERRERNQQLRDLSVKKLRAFYESQIGRHGTALFEPAIADGRVFGYTENYVRVSAPAKDAASAELARVQYEAIRPGIVDASVTEVVAHRAESILLPIL